MTGLFDGMGTVLAATFGDPVTHVVDGEDPVVLQGRFRATPLEVFDDEGRAQLILEPTLRVTAPVAQNIATDDLITPGNGQTYRVLNRHDSGSPAADAFVIFKLREVT